jgi:acetyltransferase-like isoleucine patch superfamily enzyme
VKKIINGAIAWVAGSLIGFCVYKLASGFKQLTLRFGSIAKQRALFPNAVNLRLDVRSEIKYAEKHHDRRGVIIGADCCLGAMAPIVLGDYVRVSRGVTLETGGLITRGDLPYQHNAKPITVGRGVWLGAGVTVLAG